MKTYKKPIFIDLYPMEFDEFRAGLRDYILNPGCNRYGLVIGRRVVLTSKNKRIEIWRDGEFKKTKAANERLHGIIREILVMRSRRPVGGDAILLRIDLDAEQSP